MPPCAPLDYSNAHDFMAFIIIKLFIYSLTQTLSILTIGKLAFSSGLDKIKVVREYRMFHILGEVG